MKSVKPKRIVICAPQLLFGDLGIEAASVGLRDAFRRSRLLADIVRLPVINRPGSTAQLDELLAWRLLDLASSYNEAIDGVVSVGFPAYYVSNPRHVAWLLVLPPWFSDSAYHRVFPPDEKSLKLRSLDQAALRRVSRIVPHSDRLSAELHAMEFANVSAPLHAPELDTDFDRAVERLLADLELP